MDFNMGSGTETPFRTGGKKAEKEAAKQEVRGRASRALLMLHDRDTVNNGITEIVALAEEIKGEHAALLVTLMAEFDDTKNAFSRSHAARLLPAVTNANFPAMQGQIGRMVQTLCKRVKDPDSSVRDSVAEALGELARVVCLREEQAQAPAGSGKAADEGQCELDLSQLSVSEESGHSLGVFFRQILLGIEGAEPHMQQGSSLALAHVIFNAGAKVEPHCEKLAKKLVIVLDRQQFSGRTQLLIAMANMIEVCPDAVVGLLKIFLPRIYAAANSSDWNTRKAAMETLETICTRISSDIIRTSRSDMAGVTDKCKYDKMKPVREAAALAIVALNKAMPVEGEGAEERPAEEQVDENKYALCEVAEQRSIAAQQEPETPRAPMQNVKASTVNRMQAPPGSVMKSGLVSCANGGGMTFVPSKEHWDTLLKHFDVITRQQDQLIDIVTSFSEATRDRLETVEQKVFALELRASHQDNRQSLPGMPPTPSRAVGTPSRYGTTPCKGTPARVPLAPFQEIVQGCADE